MGLDWGIGVTERNLDGRVAIITGGGGAIGEATAERLARAGAKVAVADIRRDAADAVAHRLVSEGLTAKAFGVDLAQESQIVQLAEDVMKAFGRVDILHNNAAAGGGVFEADKTLLDLTAEVWDKSFAVNVRAPMLLSKAVAPHMLRQGGGVIINTSSGASEMPAADARTAYGASKAALNMLTRYIAAQYGPGNIRCNAVLPGVVMTKGMQKLFGQAELEAMNSRSMLRRGCTPEDVAAMVHYLASDDAGQITGELFRVNAGRA
jgi:NAD(P)-dependent dehydrogenase (short-subunit alcohol dehydrogenase family)